MNVGFLILVVAPLSVYLVILLISLKDIPAADTPTLQKSAHDRETISTLDTTDVSEPARVEPVASTLPTETTADIAFAATVPLADAHVVEISSAAPEIVATAVLQEPAPPVAPPPPSSESEAMPLPAATAPDAAAEPIAAADATLEITTGVAAETKSPPPSATDASTADAAIITEPAPIEATENAPEDETTDQELPEGPLQFPEKGSPKFVFDYRGRLWVEKKQRGFFKQLRRPQLPPDEPQ